jgi:hypothetical protein
MSPEKRQLLAAIKYLSLKCPDEFYHSWHNGKLVLWTKQPAYHSPGYTHYRWSRELEIDLGRNEVEGN